MARLKQLLDAIAYVVYDQGEPHQNTTGYGTARGSDRMVALKLELLLCLEAFGSLWLTPASGRHD